MMSLAGELYFKTVSLIYALYIRFVYWSSRVEVHGSELLAEKDRSERFLFLFWHGESYCLYPLLRHRKAYAVVTSDRRGNYIAPLCRHFGYIPVRLPDKKGHESSFHVLRTSIEKDEGDLLVALDGPSGPFHFPREFPFVLAMYFKYRIVPISIEIRNRINLGSRWDRLAIPLPFTGIRIRLHYPISLTGKDLEEDFSSLKKQVRSEMESNGDAQEESFLRCR